MRMNGLEIKLEGVHIIITDGCVMDTERSAIVHKTIEGLPDDPGRGFSEAERDRLSRGTSRGPARRFMFYRNIDFVEVNLRMGVGYDAKCQTCGIEYRFGREIWQKAVDLFNG